MKLENLLTNCGTLSVDRYAGIPNGTIQRSTLKFDICACVALDVGMVRVDIDYRSVISRTNWFPFVLFDNVSSILIATNSSGPVAGKIFIMRLERCLFPFLAQLSHLTIIAYKPFTI